MDRLGHSSGRNSVVQRVAGRRRVVESKPNRVLEQTVSASNTTSRKAAIVGTALVGGSLGATSAGIMAALTHAPILNCMGVGALAGAAGGILAQWVRLSFQSNWENIIENYLSQHDLRTCEKNLLAEIDNVRKCCEQRYPDVTFQFLTERQVRGVMRYCRNNAACNSFQVLSCVLSLDYAHGRVDLYVVPIRKTVEGEEDRRKFKTVLAGYQKARRELKVSMGTLLARNDIPFFHANPDITNNEYKSYASPSLPSQASAASEELIVSTQLRKRAISKKTGVVSTPVESGHGFAEKQSETNHEIVHGPTYLRQVDQGLPTRCIKDLKKIEEDIKYGKITSKSIGGLYVYVVSMGDDKGKGRWRLMVQRLKTAQKGDTYQFNEICDYHSNPPVLWAGVKRV